MELFENYNKTIKIKDNSKSSKKIQKKFLRDVECFSALKEIPNDGEICSFVSRGLSDAGSFLYAVSEIEGVIKEAVIATWTISKNNIIKILDYVDSGKIEKLYFLLNDGMLKTNSTKPIYAFLRNEFDKRKNKIKYAVANSHAKIQMYKTEKKYITISGSGNWSENPRIENYIIICDEETYNFNAKWIKELL